MWLRSDLAQLGQLVENCKFGFFYDVTANLQHGDHGLSQWSGLGADSVWGLFPPALVPLIRCRRC